MGTEELTCHGDGGVDMPKQCSIVAGGDKLLIRQDTSGIIERNGTGACFCIDSKLKNS